MNATPREIWYWLTAGALEKLRAIQAQPLDTPISHWEHVAGAAFCWLVALGVGMCLLVKRAEGHEARVRARERWEAETGRVPRTATIVWQSLGIVVTGVLSVGLLVTINPDVAGWAFWVAVAVAVAWYRWGFQDIARRLRKWWGARLGNKNDA
jgi:membrane protein required for beta-lactamase induction